jgi:hypothetical protein
VQVGEQQSAQIQWQQKLQKICVLSLTFLEALMEDLVMMLAGTKVTKNSAVALC